jgi:anti-sigma-K factor RskA
MASYKSPELRDKLAAEYVIGTLRGRARLRFQSLLRYDAGLRHIVAEWEQRLTPLAVAAGEVAPPARLWQVIARRIGGGGAKGRLAFWRGLAVASTAFALVLATFVGTRPAPELPMASVAVMADEKGQPSMVVSWPSMKEAREPYVRVKVLQEHPKMAAGTAWELWMLPRNQSAPASMGLISTDASQVIRIKADLAKRFGAGEAWGIAMSVEPAGGSPTGAPTGPVIFKGQCFRIL